VPQSKAVSIPGFISLTATIGSTRLHYWTGGDSGNPPVILWHGFLGSSYVWRKVAPQLVKRGFSVLVPDMRGYGDSDKPEGTAGYDAAALAEEFRLLARTIGFTADRPLIVAAHDMGAPPALLWAANHPAEIAGLIYIDEPVLLPTLLSNIISYTPEAMAHGSMWWWILPLAPQVPERLIVGNERAFLTWFYHGDHVAKHEVFDPETVDEYLRAFSGREGVLGALGVYRAAFTTMAQTEPLTTKKVAVPVTAMGGKKGLGEKVGNMMKLVASNFEAITLPDCGHFVPEECPDAVVQQIVAMREKTQ
jgi:pimeloyl-ACP methyl ester carboxylesterase